MTLGYTISAIQRLSGSILSRYQGPLSSQPLRTFCLWRPKYSTFSTARRNVCFAADPNVFSSISNLQILTSVAPSRTLFTLPRTFPAKTRGYLDFQESLRKADGVPRGVELVYLLPGYHSIFLELSDPFYLAAFYASFAFTLGYFVWRQFIAEDDVEESVIKDDSDEYVIDEQGRKWKRKKMKLSIQIKAPDTKAVAYFNFLSITFLFLVCRINNARTPLRIYYHPSLRHYYAVFPRYWRKNRVSPFPPEKVILRHGKFRILTTDGSSNTLPNKVASRHFRDEEHSAVFIKQRAK